ncbi:MAG: carbohydrate ABC transporter permease [Rubrobacteraceae bacterium]
MRRWYPLLPMVPGLLFLLAFSVYPLVYALRVSLFDLNLLEAREPRFVGLQNFASILSSQDFWHPLTVTLKFVVGATSLQLLLGLGLAMLFYRRFPVDRFMRALLILPMVVAPVVVALLWRYLVNPDYGLINYFIKLLGFGPVDFFGSAKLALPSLIIVDTWQWTPFMFLIILAGLQGIPREVEEAAKVDGANAIQTFFYCLLPLLRYPIAVALLLRVIDAFRIYDLVFMTTRGGPINVTDTMSWHIYNVGFRSFDISYAAAYAWLMLIVVLIVTTLIVRVMFRREDLN